MYREEFDETGKRITREEIDAASPSDHQNHNHQLEMGIRSVGVKEQMLFDGPPPPPPPPPLPAPQPRGNVLNTITPCAACKLLRRRCAEECPFYPYFSPHEPYKFAVVHKIFGASNVSKMLLEVPESQRADAANSLVYEANVRLRDPVYGCMGAISALQQQVQTLQAELNLVRAEIFNYKYREAAAVAATVAVNPDSSILSSSPPAATTPSMDSSPNILISAAAALLQPQISPQPQYDHRAQQQFRPPPPPPPPPRPPQTPPPRAHPPPPSDNIVSSNTLYVPAPPSSTAGVNPDIVSATNVQYF
ncbi:hypothetical protein Drorol1_Dr00003355 [Drosera rotundifolia]